MLAVSCASSRHETRSAPVNDAKGTADDIENADADRVESHERLSADNRAPSLAEQGRHLHQKLIAAGGATQAEEWPVLDGALSKAKVIINVPVREWDALDQWQRQLLMRYVASMVDAVRRDPFTYTRIPRSAPAAPLVRRHASRMTRRSWGIIVGRVDREGYIIADRLAVSGRDIDIESLPATPR